jgi:hypothetical protein
MDTFPDEIWLMIFEDVANTILEECEVIDFAGTPSFGEVIKQYPRLRLVCRRFYWLWTGFTGQLLARKLLDLAEERWVEKLVRNKCAGEDELEIWDIKATCGNIWRSRKLETLLQTY